MNKNTIDIWSVLGIEPTTDKRTIKRAYAQAVKSCHPEEHPEAFKQLYEAYQAALNGLAADNMMPADRHGTAGQRENLEIFSDNDADNISGASDINDENDDAEGEKFRAIFEQDSSKKLNAWNQLTDLWSAYLKEQSQYNETALIRFLQGSEFSVIRDLEAVMVMTSKMTAEKGSILSRGIVDAVWNIYGGDEVPEELTHKELYYVLQRERSRYARMQQEKRDNIRSRVSWITWFGVLAAIILGIFMFALNLTKENKMRQQCRDAAEDIISHTYPDFTFGGPMNQWEIADGDTENIYMISTEAALKGIGENKAVIRIQVKRDEKGNAFIVSDDFKEKSIKLISNHLGIACDTSAVNDPDKNYIIVELRAEDFLPGFSDNICSLSEKRTVRNQNLSGIAFRCRNSVYSDYYLSGGEGGLPRAVIWDMEEISQLGSGVLKEDILQAVREYYFHYEPWHLKNTVTDEDEKLYNKAAAMFESKQEQLRKVSVETQELYETAKACGVSVLLFEDVSEYKGEVCITEGDLYRIMLKSGGTLDPDLSEYIDDKSTKGDIIYFADAKKSDIAYTVYYNQISYTFGEKGNRIMTCDKALSILKGEIR